MKLQILAPMGRAEPDDIKGWFTQGGFVGLQAAWALPVAELRRRLAPIQRRYGVGTLGDISDQLAIVDVSMPAASHILVEEMPAYIIEGALVWARACGQSEVTICVADEAIEHLHLLQDVAQRMAGIDVLGAGSFTNTNVIVVAREADTSALDAVTARLLPIVLWEGVEPPVTLVTVEGNIASPGVYEIPIGTALRDLLFNWAGGLTPNASVSLAGRPLDKTDWNLPLTPATLGDGRITAG